MLWAGSRALRRGQRDGRSPITTHHTTLARLARYGGRGRAKKGEGKGWVGGKGYKERGIGKGTYECQRVAEKYEPRRMIG